MAMKEVLEQTVLKILDDTRLTGKITTNELAIINMYNKECDKEKKLTLDDILKGSMKIVGTIDKIMGGLK